MENPELIDDIDEEYAAAVCAEPKEEQKIEPQQEEQSKELSENILPEKNSDLAKIQEDISLSLQNISETLKLLQAQRDPFDKYVNELPKLIENLSNVIIDINKISKDLPDTLHEQCLNEYKKIVNNAAKNYKQFQRAANKWQQSLEETNNKKLNLITISAVITPILLLLLIIIKY